MMRIQEKIVGIGIGLVIALLIAIAILAFNQVRQTNRVTSGIEYTRHELMQLSDLYNTTIQHASAARDYALSVSEEDIQRMQLTAGNLLSQLNELKTPAERVNRNSELLDSLTKYINRRIDFSNQIIAAGKEKGQKAASDLYQTGTGREYNNMVHIFIQKMQAEELSQLSEDEKKSARGITRMSSYLFGLLVVILILIFILVQKIRLDISKRKEAENNLKNFNHQLQEQVAEKTAELTGLFQRITDGFISLDRNFRFTYVNKRAGEMTNRDPETFIGKNLWEEFGPMITPAFKEAIEKAMVDQKYIHFEEYSASYDRWFEDHIYPSPEGFSIFYRDISPRKKAEEEIRKSEERYRALIEQASDAIMITDQKGNFIDVNTSFCRQFGYTKEELRGLNVSKVIDPNELKNDPVRFDLLISGQTISRERRMMHKSGRIIEVEANVKMLPDGRMLAIARDISERKRSEEELRISRENLEKSYQEIRQLASNIEKIREEEKIKIAREIHDELGQQLTGLKMDVSWLSKKLKPEETMLHEKIKDIMALLDEAVKSVRRIASELRPGLLDDLGLVAAIEWQSEEFEKRSGIKVEFTHSMPNGNLPTHLATGLFRIYQESLTNVARHAQAHVVHVSLYQLNDEVILKISDDGKGFDAREIQNKRTLGLLGMKERTMMMGGKYEVTSEPGKGTTVTVSVSLQRDKTEKIKSDEASSL